MPGDVERPILIAGPTASGKSALAIHLAERHGGTVINADSMQVYRELRVLTARPGAEDERRVPHLLFGHVGGTEPYSVARWLGDVAQALAQCRAERRRAIIVGGTGLYFMALTEGLSQVPPIPPEVRGRLRAAADELPPGALHRELQARDPVVAARLAPGDRQRIVRALEVIEATGRSLADWQGDRGAPLVPLSAAEPCVIAFDRRDVYARCDRRFEAMLAEGALAEVEALAARNLSPELPVMRAIGVRPLLALIRGEIDRAEAVRRGQVETRQYVKRQLTWLRRNMMSWRTIEME